MWGPAVTTTAEVARGEGTWGVKGGGDDREVGGRPSTEVREGEGGGGDRGLCSWGEGGGGRGREGKGDG